MKVLHVDSSILGAGSVSRQVTAAVVGQLKAAHPGAQVVYRDVVAQPLAHLDGELMQVVRPAPGAAVPAHLQQEAALTEALMKEFLEADAIVIGAPMYNFAVPTQLKAWIDRLAQAGRTFKYTATGPVGLAGGKKVIVVSSRGGMYAGTPYEAAMDHQEAYLKAVMGFFGITDVQVIRAEGVAMGDDARAAALKSATALAAKAA